MMLTTAAAAIQILNNVMGALNAARERAKASKDSDLKENISTLYDHLLDLKEAVARIIEENAGLSRRVEELERGPEKPQPRIRQVGQVIYYYVGDDGPFCQPCYDHSEKLVRLMPSQEYFGGNGRKCEVCNKVFFERPVSSGHVISPDYPEEFR